MRIAVLGAGAIGCLFGFRLHQSGQEVLLIHHKPSIVRTIKRSGIVVRELSGSISKAHINAKQALSGKDDPDLILLTVKAYDTINIAKSLRARKSMPSVGILTLQNGLGNIETLSSQLPAKSIIAGSTTEGALQTAPGRIVHTGKGSTWIGEPSGLVSQRSRVTSRVLRLAGFETEVSSTMLGVIWAKAIVNSGINPITALTGSKNGDLLVIPSLRELTEKVIDESYAVSRAKGIHAKPNPKLLLKRILRMTSSNRSSMLQDVQASRRTEIHQLNGQIVEEGRRLRVPTPYNRTLLELVSGIEALNQKFESSVD